MLKAVQLGAIRFTFDSSIFFLQRNATRKIYFGYPPQGGFRKNGKIGQIKLDNPLFTLRVKCRL